MARGRPGPLVDPGEAAGTATARRWGSRECLASMLGPRHNETLNAWSLLGILACSAAAFWRGRRSRPELLLLLSACVHAPVGAAYHTFRAHSPETQAALLHADYLAVMLSSLLLAAALSGADPGCAAAAALPLGALALLERRGMSSVRLTGAMAAAVAYRGPCGSAGARRSASRSRPPCSPGPACSCPAGPRAPTPGAP